MAVEFVAASSQRANLGLSLPFLNGKPGGSVMAWVKMTSLSGTRSLTEQAIGPPPGTSATSRLFLGVLGSGVLELGARDADGGGSFVNTGTLSIGTGVWAHVAGVVDIAGDASHIYINGALHKTQAFAFPNASFPATNSKNGHVGSNDDGGAQFFDGLISDFRMYDRALKAEEIQTIFAARGRDTIIAGMVLNHRMAGRPPGAVASVVGELKDVSISQRNADPVNGPVYRESFVSGYRRRSA
jgi:hypothetical protein